MTTEHTQSHTRLKPAFLKQKNYTVDLFDCTFYQDIHFKNNT